MGASHDDRLAELVAKRTETEAELTKLKEQWEKEKDLTTQIRNIRLKLEMTRLDGKIGDVVAAAEAITSSPETAVAATAETETAAGDDASGTAAAPAPETAKPVDTEVLKSELKRLNAELKQVQGEDPLMQPVVNGQSVAEVISGWTGIPIGKMVADEINAVLNLHETDRKSVV